MKNNHKYIGRCGKGAKVIAFTALSVLAVNGFAAESWPGESWKNAAQFGGLDDAFSDGDISGAHWNNNTKTLWLSDNKEEMIWSLVETNSGFSIDKSFDAKGDLEGITQAMDDSVLYLMDEDRYIRAYDAESGKSITTWKLEDALPSSGRKGKDGPEGITFIPDAWLNESGFVDEDGKAYTESKYSFGGIFLVAHQNGGGVYAFDLSSNGSFHFIGQYDTAASESSGLAFDRSTGILYISHNVDGNTLETTNLQSKASDGHREFVTQAEFKAPNDSNLEGFAIKPAINEDNTPNDVWAFYTDDDGNTSDGNAILVFKDLDSSLTVTTGNNQVADASSAVSRMPAVQITDKFNNALAGVDVTFSVSQGGGALTGKNTATDASGIAELESWVLGSTGTQKVNVKAGNLSTIIEASLSKEEVIVEPVEPVTPIDPEPLEPIDSTEITVTASGGDGDNIAKNVLDDNPSTRWSASGEQWLQLNLGSKETISGVSFSFYKGNDRSAIFDIETSIDGKNWDLQLETVYSSGNSTKAEGFYFDNNVEVKFVRYIGYGNDSSSSSSAKWNSILEAKILTTENTNSNEIDNTDNDEGEATNSPITSLSIVSFSDEQSSNAAKDLFDGKTSDKSGGRWSAKGLKNETQWVVIDMGASYEISQVTLYPYASRAYQYEVQLSNESDANFISIVDRSDNTKNEKSLTDTVDSTASGRYLRLEVQGADDYSGNWASINELKIEGRQK